MSFQIDLDASRRERQQPEGIPLVLGGEDFLLPAELPLEVFDPFLDESFDLAGLIREGITRSQEVDENGHKRGIDGAVVDILFLRPDLPLDLINRVFAAFEVLFGGPEEYARFKTCRPSLNDYAALFKGLYRAYAVSLGEAFGSMASSDADGPTQKPTSPASTASTSEMSSAPAIPSMADEMAAIEAGAVPGSAFVAAHLSSTGSPTTP